MPSRRTEERRFSDLKIPQALAEHHAMPASLVFKVIVQPLLGTQALNKLQVRFLVLRTEITGRVIASQFKTPILIDDAMLPEYLLKHLRH
ncbi:hypothetical protein D3C84_1007990 [compost metagenome]